jgi:hypothetical protein
MPFIKDMKADTAAKHARRAAEEGRTVLVFLVDVPRAAGEGKPVSGVAEQIEAVEAQGWQLQSLGARDAGSMIALFRRAQARRPSLT